MSEAGANLRLPVPRAWLQVTLLQFLVIAFGGLLLRWLQVAPQPGLNYRFVLHAHSHGAILGWLYPAFFLVLVQLFLPAELRQQRIWNRLFWLSQLAVLGMLLSFPVQGYGAVSITFSTLHIVLSYGFVWCFWRSAGKAAAGQQEHQQYALRWVKLSLLFLVLSSFGPWSLGPIMATGHAGSALYYNAIYFYLHFQYNGWLTFALLGVFFQLLGRCQIKLPQRQARWIFYLFAAACLPAFLLSVLWTEPSAWVYGVAAAAALAQVAGLVLLLQLLWRIRLQVLPLLQPWAKALWGLDLLAFGLKLSLQAVSALPAMAALAYKVRLFVIGYLHLSLIGFVSLFLLGLFVQLGWLNLRHRLPQLGISCFLTGFITSELLLFGQGTLFWLRLGPLPLFNEMLFAISILMPVGLTLLVRSQFQLKRHKPAAVVAGVAAA